MDGALMPRFDFDGRASEAVRVAAYLSKSYAFAFEGSAPSQYRDAEHDYLSGVDILSGLRKSFHDPEHDGTD